MAEEQLVHKGRWYKRMEFECHQTIRERAFSERWRWEQDHHSVLSMLLRQSTTEAFDPWTGMVPFDRSPITQEEATVAATVIQWLGSNVGFDFLEQSLKACGYKLSRAPKDKA